MKRRKIWLDNEGSSLAAVLIVMLIVMVLGTAVVQLVTQQTKDQIYYENDIGALQAAEAGLNQYLWYLNKESGTISLGADILYPQDKPVAAFRLNVMKDVESVKTVQAVGWMLGDPTVTRTVEATYQKRSFTQYIYFSDSDPDGIWWTNYDICYGPYHTNTKLSSKGHPTFWGKATSVKGLTYYTSAASDTPNFYGGYQQLATPIEMPTNNSQLMSYGKSSEGYYYEGRTSIRLNNNGTITVWNPNDSPATKTVPLPKNGVIYVNERSGASKTNTFDTNSGNVFISGVLDGRLTVAAKNNIYITGYDPTVSNLNSAAATNGILYKDTSFSLNTSTGKLTINEARGSAEADMLGLIADNNVGILTQGWFSGSSSINSSRSNMYVYAAIMSINGKFINTMFMSGSPSSVYPNPGGNLYVRGSIIQSTRGAMGLFNSSTGVTTSGYSKNYAHDTRMLYDSPPQFLSPENSGWEIVTWSSK